MHLTELRAFFNEERTRRGVSWADISEGTDIPETTVRKILSGHTVSPSYDNIMDLIAFFGMPKDPEKKEAIVAEVEITKLKEDDTKIGEAVKTLNDVYEAHISTLNRNTDIMKAMYEQRIADLKEEHVREIRQGEISHQQHAHSLRTMCWALGISLAVVLAAILVVLFIDITTTGIGWLRR